MRTEHAPQNLKSTPVYALSSYNGPTVDVLPWADPYITQLFARPLAAPRGPRRWPNATAAVIRSR